MPKSVASIPICVVNHLSEKVAREGSVLKELAPKYDAILFDKDIFSTLSNIVERAMFMDDPWVIIEGGDGTAQGVITAFMKRRSEFKTFPTFTLLPGGMTNQVAGNIGLSKRDDINILLRQKFTQEHLGGEDIADIFEGKEEAKISSAAFPLIQISSESYPDYYGFLFSTGAIPMVTQYTKAKLHKRGIGGSMAVMGGIMRAVTFGSHKVMHTTPIVLTTDKRHISELHLGTVVTTLPNLILGIDPFWGDQSRPLRVTYAAGNTRRLLRNILSIWRGNKKADRSVDGFHSWTANELTYAYDGPIVLDGEFLDIKGEAFTVTATEPVNFLQAT
ncbi:MAG: diacylglycerol kinase family protein [Maricaulaceae bacterium]